MLLSNELVCPDSLHLFIPLETGWSNDEQG